MEDYNKIKKYNKIIKNIKAKKKKYQWIQIIKLIHIFEKIKMKIKVIRYNKILEIKINIMII